MDYFTRRAGEMGRLAGGNSALGLKIGRREVYYLSQSACRWRRPGRSFSCWLGRPPGRPHLHDARALWAGVGGMDRRPHAPREEGFPHAEREAYYPCRYTDPEKARSY